MKTVNGISIVGKTFGDIGAEMSAVTGTTGEKPKYIVVDIDQHEEMLGMDNVKIKQGRVLKYKGMSVVVTL